MPKTDPKFTCIRISSALKVQLDRCKHLGQSYDGFITELLNQYRRGTQSETPEEIGRAVRDLHKSSQQIFIERQNPASRQTNKEGIPWSFFPTNISIMVDSFQN